MSSVGYSAKAVWEKLGLKPEMQIAVIGQDVDYAPLVEMEFSVWTTLPAEAELVHLFAVERAMLERELDRLWKECSRQVVVWVSWPKKASKVPTDIDEQVIRDVCLPMGWVDVKVCAVSDVWSGLKLVVRKELR